MTAHRQLYVRFTDGTGRVERQEHNDEVGKKVIEREAFRLMESGRVASVQSRVVDYVTQTGGSVR